MPVPPIVPIEPRWPLAPFDENQEIFVIVCGGSLAVLILLWVIPYVNKVLYPFKLLTVFMHEMCHLLVGVATCAKIESMQIDPEEGGATQMSGGVQCLTLPAGYLGSCFIGAALIVGASAGWVPAIIESGFIAIVFIICLWWEKNCLTRVFSLAVPIVIGILWILFWVGVDRHAIALRVVMIFVGTFNCMYAIEDIFDDTIKRKAHESDASQCAKMVHCCDSRVIGVIWSIIAILYFGVAVYLGMALATDWVD